MPMPNGTYTMLKTDGGQVGGMFKLPEEAKKMGAPAHWLLYVAVSEADTSTAKAQKLGAKVLAGPKDVGPGKMSVLQDPTGGIFALWQSGGEHSMPFLFAEDRSFCWGELMSDDVEAAKKFYTGLFGWKTEPFDMGDMTYNVVKSGEQGMGGIMPKPKEMPAGPIPWMVYFAVSDTDATVQKAQKLGAEVMVPPTDIPKVGRFAVLKDTEGAPFAIIKGEPMG
jgi:uncharacterized protein